MNAHDEDRLKRLLRQTLPPPPGEQPTRDLWPEVLRRLDAHPDPPPWFDWALAAALLGFAALAPALIPVLLFYL